METIKACDAGREALWVGNITGKEKSSVQD